MVAHNQKLIALISGVLSALLIALFLGSVAYASKQRSEAALERYGGQIVEICVAKRDLKAGHRLTANDIAYKKWPVSLLAGEPILKKNTLGLRDRRLAVAVVKGQPLNRETLARNLRKLDAIAEGYTAVTLETSSVRALGGEITAGMGVTVMTTLPSQKAEVLVDSAEVLSSSKQANREEETGLITGGSAPEITWVTLAIPDELVKEVVAASVADATYIVLPKDARAFSRDAASFSDDASATLATSGLNGGER